MTHEGSFTINEVRAKENMNPVDGGDTLRVPLNMTEAAQPVGMGGQRDFGAGVERRSTPDDNKAALSFTGVKADHYDLMRKGIHTWLRHEADALIRFIDSQTEQRTDLGEALTLWGKVKSYYADLEDYMPEDLERAINDISQTAYADACEALGAETPLATWFEGRLKYFYGDEMKRLKSVNMAEIEAVFKKAIGQDKAMWAMLRKTMNGWADERADGIAKTEAALVRNKMLIRTIRKAGYQAVWKTAPGCCELCQRMNGVVVTTLSPPLHKGCCCTVDKGKRNEGYQQVEEQNKNADLRKTLSNVKLQLKDKQLGKKVGKHAKEFGWDVENPNERVLYGELVNDVFYDYEEQRLVEWEYNVVTQKRDILVLARIKGDDVVLTKLNGDFITLFKGAKTNSRIMSGKVIET